MFLQSCECSFSVRQRQADRPSRAFACVIAASADFVRAGPAVASGQLHHDAPLHLIPQSAAFSLTYTTPRFETVSRRLTEHGGLDRVRDRGAVESALARPRNQAGYGDPDAADLAAAYVYGLARNDVFSDGNKPTAWVVARLFLLNNGYRLQFDPHDAVITMTAVAAGELDEPGLAAWFHTRLDPQPHVTQPP
jgi:death-on-curing protein